VQLAARLAAPKRERADGCKKDRAQRDWQKKQAQALPPRRASARTS